MRSLLQYAHYGVRQLRRNPVFTITVVLTLALAIGANTAIFSIVNALLLRSLPYSHPERIATIYTRIRGPFVSDERHHLDGEQWELLRDNVPALTSAISGTRPSGVNLEADSHAQYVQAGRVSAHYLDVLAVRPIIGRNFSESEDIPNGPKTVIVTYNLWRNTFGADRNVIGKTVLLKGEPHTVVGVLPEEATIPLSADVYTAIQAARQGEGSGTNFECIIRLRDGATWQEADAEITRAWNSRSNRYELADSPGADVSYYSVPLQKGQTDPLRSQMLTLMLAAGFILLIACANLAGLTVVRVLRRTPEIATRLALGASQWQIEKQLWVENLVLALMGGLAGAIVGFLALRGLLLLLPQHFLPAVEISLDARVLAFTAAASLLTSVLFGMLPTFVTRRFDLRTAMASRGSIGADRLRLRQVLLAGEVALTVLLLAASGLLIRSLVHLQRLTPGFDSVGVMTARASLDDARYHNAAAFRQLLNQSVAAMQQIPGVQYAAVGLSVPYERALNNGVMLSDGQKVGQQIITALAYVTPDYFAALRIPLLSGRNFDDGDGPNKQRVAIVNQTFVHRFFGEENPIGHHLDKDTLVVGVVGDVAMAPGIDPIAPLSAEQMMYVPAAQVESQGLSLIHVWFQPSWIVRTSAPLSGLTAQMQRALAGADPNLPFSGFYRMDDLLAKTLAMQRVEVALLTTIGVLALVLSAVGILGLVANIVSQKTREIGIRIALGSTYQGAMLHVGVPAMRSSALGLVLGLVLCAGALPVMRSVLYGIKVYDMPTILAVVVALTSVTFIAAAVPTLRIARIDPAETLRDE